MHEDLHASGIGYRVRAGRRIRVDRRDLQFHIVTEALDLRDRRAIDHKGSVQRFAHVFVIAEEDAGHVDQAAAGCVSDNWEGVENAVGIREFDGGRFR